MKLGKDCPECFNNPIELNEGFYMCKNCGWEHKLYPGLNRKDILKVNERAQREIMKYLQGKYIDVGNQDMVNILNNIYNTNYL